MAKAKKSDGDIFAELAKAFEGQVLDEPMAAPYYIDTGSLTVNYALSGKFLGGGIPGGKITEIFGPESSGKSYWGTNIVRGTQSINGIAVVLDCENSLTSDFAVSASHVDISKVSVYKPETLEQAFLKIYNIIRFVREKVPLEIPLVIVYDSLSSSPCERELRETQVSENATQAEWKRVVGGKEQPGERAKICSKEFRKLESLLAKTNTSLFVINQTRMKVGVMYGSPITTAGGGESLKFYAGCRIRTSTAKKIEKKIANSSLTTVLGVGLNMKVVKNKCFKPYWEANDVKLYFDKGVNPVSGLLDCLIKAERVEMTGKVATYKVKEPWAGGVDVTFKCTKAENTVDVDVLCKCPKLIDAQSEQEVRDYLNIFKSAMELKEEAVETDVTNQDELLDDDYEAEKDD